VEENMSNGSVTAIYFAPAAGAPMIKVDGAWVLKGKGIFGDRYGEGVGSFNKKNPGTRQVTFINGMFFQGSGFEYQHSRRNIITDGAELNWLIGREFKIGDALFRGTKYCDPCERPNKLAGITSSFKAAFFDRGGLVAEVLQDGYIETGSIIVPPQKGY
jgi:hypothetical protein